MISYALFPLALSQNCCLFPNSLAFFLLMTTSVKEIHYTCLIYTTAVTKTALFPLDHWAKAIFIFP